mmetsp:Transcript_142026/g.395852  ORF Transcript_142026/g.395852 Transcript_142026/m.395852 type:complete len:211 (-) Transcript_142026:397-1029(-)
MACAPTRSVMSTACKASASAGAATGRTSCRPGAGTSGRLGGAGVGDRGNGLSTPESGATARRGDKATIEAGIGGTSGTCGWLCQANGDAAGTGDAAGIGGAAGTGGTSTGTSDGTKRGDAIDGTGNFGVAGGTDGRKGIRNLEAKDEIGSMGRACATFVVTLGPSTFISPSACAVVGCAMGPCAASPWAARPWAASPCTAGAFAAVSARV